LRRCSSDDNDQHQLLAAFKAEDGRWEAAKVLQAHWRARRARINFSKMRRGFVQLQRLHRRRRKGQERLANVRLVESQRRFQEQLDRMKARRMALETKYREISEAPLQYLGFTGQPGRRASTRGEEVEADVDEERERAALVIQAGVRRYLQKSLLRRDWLKTFSVARETLNEAAVKRYREEIEEWQRKNKTGAANMTPAELQHLQMSAHQRYVRFMQSAERRRASERRTRTAAAAAEAIASQLTSAPSLAEGCAAEERARFRSLPMAAAVRGRMDHKHCMAKLNWPAWRRRLET